MGSSRLEQGQSDPVSYECTCSAVSVGGTVLLFYRYWSNAPQLPESDLEKAKNLEEFAEWHTRQASRYNLTGKIRIAREGYNITVAGTTPEIDQYIKECRGHWSLAGLDLDTKEKQNLYFKPTEGCACVFGSEKKTIVRITAEITPMGVEGYAPSDWGNIEALSPEEFHRRCHEEASLLMDVRNVYESRIGYFVNPRTGQPALRPLIRRFSQWPQYIQCHLQDMNANEHRQIMTYCTGGIRCEKATRWMQEKSAPKGEQKICTLEGGIVAYLAWMEEEIKQGRKQPTESLFQGRNYVFDGRGSTGLDISTPMEPVAKCHICAIPTDNLGKCCSMGCHLILVVCLDCGKGNPRCCQDCHNLDQNIPIRLGTRPMCTCERQRETELWAGHRVKTPRTQGWRKEKRKTALGRGHIDVHIKVIE